MVFQKGLPFLGRRVALSNHVLCNSGLGHLNAEHFQVAVDARGTPNDIVARHRPDQLAHVGINCGTTTLPPLRFPCPVEPESLTVPSDQGVGLEDHQCLQARGP